ncbi:MAG TPA: L-aspartate oxidase [Acidimicrobiia bacterium]|nr:L-aspartate oxidase [Acidimicrobiia bacterium]
MTEIVRLEAPIVVGAGVAGLTVALGLDRACVISSREMGSTWWAQGGIAVAMSPDDSPQDHAADTIAASAGLAIEDAVATLTQGGPEAISRLVQIGTEFDRDDEGRLVLGKAQGHRARRLVHADRDATGAEVMRALTAEVDSAESIEVVDERVVDLARSGDRVAGVVTADGKRRKVYLAPGVVMATGGAGRMYQRTTNPPGASGEGIVIASRAGARLADLEFVQFHPTAMNAGKDPMPLLPEILREEGATLVDGSGLRFMDRYHPRAELAPHAVLARAIWHHAQASSAFLDTRSVVNFHERFPTVTAHAMSVGLNPSEHLIPVSPAAHFAIGGIDADTTGRTSVAGLWAVGECASTGVHGANRLSSNSLLEGLVFGARVALDVRSQGSFDGGDIEIPADALEMPVVAGPVVEDLREVMWDKVGLIRTGEGLQEARNAIMEMEPILDRTISGRNAADLAMLMTMAALGRSESRGGHYRADFPDEDPSQGVRSLVSPGAVDARAILS